jgi:diadenosine tetraphosphate (Ap4A) HIT family hydrolase
MGYAKERGKLEQLPAKIAGLDIYNEKNFVILNDIHEKYSHTVRILKNKELETFSELYSKELQEVKAAKKSVKESETDEVRQENFIQYKNIVLSAIEKTIQATIDSL